MRQEYDVAIVGGGMVGNILARCFSRCGQRVILFDEEKSRAFGGIEVPISIRRVNQEFLAEIDMWHKTQSEIRRLHISASGHFGVVKIEEEEPLAYVTSAQQWLEYVKSQIEADQGVNVLSARVKSCDRLENVEVLETQDGQKFKAKRVVIADGASSPLANYLQVKVKRSGKAVRSVIFGVTAGNQLESSAWIRQKGGVIYGVIPKQGNQGWVVATMPLRSANSKSDAALIHDLGECLESHIGCIESINKLSSKDSVLQSRVVSIRPGIMIMGNASLQLPPIGAQGLNIAIEDCMGMMRLQKKYQWQQECAQEWQAQYSKGVQERHDRWYTQMESVLCQLSDRSILSLWKEKIAWALLGVDGRLQKTLLAVGSGIG